MATWLLSIPEMGKGVGTHYPYIADGAGNDFKDKTEPDFKFTGEFNAEYYNHFYKDIIRCTAEAYEE